MPDLQATYEDFSQRELVVLGITTEEQSTVAEVAAKEGLTFPVLLDPGGTVTARYRVNETGHPANYLVDQTGKIAGRRLGYADREALAALLEAVFD